MRETLKRWYNESETGFEILYPFVRFREFLREGWMPDRMHIARGFRQTFGYPLDWNTPKTLNEKMCWMKLHYRDPRQRLAADKYTVRDLVRETVGEHHLIPLIQTYKRAQDIRLAELPDAFALKVNHGSGQNLLVREKCNEDEGRIRRQFREWMRISHYTTSREWPYKGMQPLIVAEELLVDEEGRIPEDYKFHCFDGRVEVVQVDIDRETRHRRNFYDTDWNLQPFIWTEWQGAQPLWPNGRDIPRPTQLKEMIEVAEKLSADFPYVRVDLFQCRSRVYFGELTFYHGSGLERFERVEYDRILGDKLTLTNSEHPTSNIQR